MASMKHCDHNDMIVEHTCQQEGSQYPCPNIPENCAKKETGIGQNLNSYKIKIRQEI